MSDPQLNSVPPSGLAQSPYRVRGQLYLGTRSYFDSKVQGGYARLLLELRPTLRGFMEQRFRAREFYEVMVTPELIDVEARVAGLSIPRYLDQRARWQSQRDLSGPKALLYRTLPPKFLVSRMAAIVTDMFNFGTPAVTRVGPGHLHVEVGGVPQRLCAWLEHSLGVYGQAIVEATGRSHVEVRSLPPTASLDGPTMHLHVQVRWNRNT